MSNANTTANQSGSKLLAYVQLFRLPNVFTALADVLMGYLFVHDPTGQPMSQFLAGVVPLSIASALLYIAGMVLNDVFDVEVDRAERPERPLPSGRIPVAWARLLGFEMLLFGAIGGIAVSFWTRDWRAGGVSLGLSALILLYNRVLKDTLLGPLAMGGCRALNVLLGMSTASAAWNEVNYVVAGGIGVYIVGVTWFSRGEAEPRSRRGQLLLATLVMYGGMALLASFITRLPQEVQPTQLIRQLDQAPQRWTLFWLVLGILIGWRCLRAVIQPYSEFVQEAVRQCLLSLIMLDAAVCFAVRDVQWAVVILLLMVPMTILGRYSYST